MSDCCPGKPSLVTGEGREAVAVALGAETGPLIIVPLAAGEQVCGALMLGRLAARPGYTETDLGMAASFAGHAAAAMELSQARADQVTLAQAEDHDRIAGDLHDHVIQELFALGMRLQGHAARSGMGRRAERNGGTFQLTTPATGGTHLAWTARPHPSGQARKAGPKDPDARR